MAFGTPVAAAVAYSAQNGTSVSPAYPSGITSTDQLVLVVGQKPSTANGGTVTEPSGWTLREELTGAGGYGTTLGADTGNTNLRFYTKDTVDGTETGNLSVTIGTNNVAWAVIVRIPTGGGTISYGSTNGSDTTGNASVSIACAADPGVTAGDIVIAGMCIPTDGTTGFSAYGITQSGVTYGASGQLAFADSGTGNDIGGFVFYDDADSGTSTAAPTITATAAGTVTNVRGPGVFLRLREAPVAQDLTPDLYTNTQTFYSPHVSFEQFLTPALFTNDQTFYSPDVTQPANTQDLTPDLYTNGQTFYSPTVAASYELTPARYDNAQTFYAPTVTTSVTLAPDLYTNGQTFYQPTVAATYALLPDLYSNAQTFYSPTVAAAYDLAPALYTNAQTFYAPSVVQAGGPQTLLPDLYTNGQTFYSATVAPGAVTLSPALYTNNQTFYQPAVTTSYELTPARYDNDQTFYPATVSQIGVQTLAPDLVTNTSTFFAATVTATYTLAPQDYVDNGYVDPNYIGPNTGSTAAFFSPSVSLTIKPALVTNTSTFFSPTVELQAYVITKAQALELYKVWLLHGLGSPLAVGATTRTAGAVEQTVSQSGSTVTVSTTGAPTTVVGNPGTMIEELAALHGLTADLVTTPTSRTAGSISQSFATSGATTTVTRQ